MDDTGKDETPEAADTSDRLLREVGSGSERTPTAITLSLLNCDKL